MGKRKPLRGRNTAVSRQHSVMRRKKDLEILAAELGLPRLFEQLPKEAVVLLDSTGILPPIAVPDTSFKKDKDHKKIIKKINESFVNHKMEFVGLNTSCSLIRFLSTFVTLNCLVSYYLRKNINVPILQPIATNLNRGCEANLDLAFNKIMWEVVNVLICYMRFDERLLVPRLQHHCPLGKPSRLLITIYRENPRSCHKVLERDEARKLYQCGSVYTKEEVEWVEWSAETLQMFGVNSKNHPLPVYVQSHAIRNLEERIGFSGDKSLAIDWTYHALRSPQCISRLPGDGEKWLVEYKYLGYRLGYFVVSILNDIVLVRTFLFLTMRGTPEQIQISNKTRTGKNKIEMMGLDKLDAYVTSDVRLDAGIRNILTECGCGHLFELGDNIRQKKYRTGHANNIRRILGMKPSASVINSLGRSG